MAKGTIQLLVPRLLKERGFTTLDMMYGARLSQGTAYHLASGEAKGITFDVLGRLCGFFDCQPNDLFEFVPDETPGE